MHMRVEGTASGERAKAEPGVHGADRSVDQAGAVVPTLCWRYSGAGRQSAALTRWCKTFPSRRFYPVLSRRATLKKVAATIVTAPSTIRWIAES
jgi:hypothetical protein